MDKLAEITGEGSAVDFGSQNRNYVLQPYQQVKDLRSGLELANPDAVLDGELDELMEAYLRWERSGGEPGLTPPPTSRPGPERLRSVSCPPACRCGLSSRVRNTPPLQTAPRVSAPSGPDRSA